MRIAFASGIENLLRRIDQSTAGRLSGLESGFRQGGAEAQKRAIMNRDASAAAEYIARRTPDYIAREQAAGAQGPEFHRGMVEGLEYQMNLSPEQKASISSRYAPQMNRGPFGGERGLGESAAMLANRPMVRRGGLGAAGLGAAVGTGALLTEGAQQLIGLMEFLQAGEDTRERAANSPLA